MCQVMECLIQVIGYGAKSIGRMREGISLEAKEEKLFRQVVYK